MGGDASALDESDDFCLLASPKVFAVGPMLMGSSGGISALRALQYRLKIPEHPPGMPDEAWLCTDFADAVRATMRSAGLLVSKDLGEQIAGGVAILCGYRGRVYAIEPDFGVFRSTREYATIGCGYKYALGSLHGSKGEPPQVRIRWALEAAEAFNAGVKAPFTILSMGADGDVGS